MTRTVVPNCSFTGYPDGVRTAFVAGRPVKVPAAYARILDRKGMLAKPKPSRKRAPPATGLEMPIAAPTESAPDADE